MAAIEKAIDAGAGCAAVLQQVAGARGAINGLMDELIEDHPREKTSRPRGSTTRQVPPEPAN